MAGLPSGVRRRCHLARRGRITPVALTFAVLDLTHSATDLGIVMAARTIALVAALLIGGVVADRAGRRSVMICADIARFIVQALIALSLLSGSASVAGLACGQLVLGAGTGFFNPASSGLMPTVAGEHLQRPTRYEVSLQPVAMWPVPPSRPHAGMALLHIRPRQPLLGAILASLTIALPTLLLAAPAPLSLILVAAVIAGMGSMTFNTLWEATLQQHVPASARSRVSSYDWFGSVAVQPIGFLLIGPLAGAIGTGPALYLSGLLELGVIMALLAVRDVRSLPAALGVDPS